MDMDISSDSSSSDEDTATGAYWDSNVGLPLTQTLCQMRNFDNFRLGAFLSIYDTLIECCQYSWEIRPVFS